jgi:lipopolysaccharide transport system permease protein
MSLVSDPSAAASPLSTATTAAEAATTDPHSDDVSNAANRVTVIEQKSPWAIFDLREAWQFRDLLTALASRDIKLRYRQTVLGPIWVIVQPLLVTVVGALLFGKFAGFASGKVPYFVFALVGVIGWNVFLQTLTKASTSLVSNSALVAKVYFPRVILPFSTILSTLFDIGISVAVLIVFMIIFQVVPSVFLFLAPIWLLLLFLLAMGIGMFTGAVMVSYRDVGPIQGIILQYAIFVTPVYYSLAQAIEKAPKAQWFMQANPVSPLLEGLRWSVFGTANGIMPPSGLSVLYAVVITLLVFLGGMLSFGQMERKFADVI